MSTKFLSYAPRSGSSLDSRRGYGRFLGQLRRRSTAPGAHDSIQLEALLGRAGRKAIATLAAALEDVFHRLREQHCGQWDLDPHGGYEYARRMMMAGRAGSWEADLLISIVGFGNGLNLAK